jgi:hypothetical protein
MCPFEKDCLFAGGASFCHNRYFSRDETTHVIPMHVLSDKFKWQEVYANAEQGYLLERKLVRLTRSSKVPDGNRSDLKDRVMQCLTLKSLKRRVS